MASDQDKQELREKMAAVVGARFGGDYEAAFRSYDADHDGAIEKDELKSLLSDAGVGSMWTRWAWAAGIIKEMDADTDERITWPEFAAAFEKQEGHAPHSGHGARPGS
ncbi:MAG: EF-hand domain-containing protein [Planctomycetes bacterium]|nr:EF-hand domain-containing protein [Planctomycetota bacterium]